MIERACAQHFAKTIDASEPPVVVGSPVWAIETWLAKPPNSARASSWLRNGAGKALRHR
jgi:hypothetical protein